MAEVRKNTVHPLHIEGYTAEGMGVARLDGRVVFIPGTIRGEDWEVQLLKVNKGVAWGKGTRLISPSPVRQEPDCPYSGRCGGCQYRHMSYEEELAAKGQRVRDALERVGGVHLELPPVLGAESPLRYRNKVQFPVSRGKCGLSIGFYRPRSHDVVDTEDWLIRHLYIRTNRAGEALCCVVANGKELPHTGELSGALRAAVPKLAGLVLNVNLRDTNVILGDAYRTLWGRDWLEEELCGLTFRLSVPSFFQINRDQTERLYQLALEFAGLTGEETVLDLYCGIGTISLCLARRAGHVIGAEVVPQAVEDARANALRNGVTNAEFFCGDAGEVAARLAGQGVRPQVICVDPPRKGLAPEVPAVLSSMAPDRIVYVSCDPATLARDVKRLEELGYRAVQAQPVDLFPRTAHVETVCLLSKLQSKEHIEIEVKMDELDLTSAESKATYEEIREYVFEHTGLKVSHLYIAQVKQEYGIIERENYNKPKSENAKQPQCPPEKEKAITEALKHFGMI